MKQLLALAGAITLSACGALQTELPQTLGEKNASFTYVPLDPLPVSSQLGDSCKEKPAVVLAFKDLLASLPDNAVRIAVGEFDSSGKLSFGPAQLGFGGKNYQVVLDYINVDATNIRFVLYRHHPEAPEQRMPYFAKPPFETQVKAQRLDPFEKLPIGDEISIPVYVGVGLRLTASITVLSGRVNLTNLGAIAAEAQAGRVSGSLVVQTLGITGKQVATSLPLPSELNATTVQNAILALGSIKAIMYDSKSATITPRVTGIYNPIAGSDASLVNAIVSELAKKPIPWYRPCPNPLES